MIDAKFLFLPHILNAGMKNKVQTCAWQDSVDGFVFTLSTKHVHANGFNVLLARFISNGLVAQLG